MTTIGKLKWTLNSPYYKKVFATYNELMLDIVVSQADSNYEIMCNGVSTGNKAIDFLNDFISTFMEDEE